MALIGIDVGTTACKVVVFDADGEALSYARKEYSLKHPKSGWAELNPEDVWKAVKVCIQKSVKECREPIVALAISSQGEGIVPLNNQLEPVGPQIVSFDLRSILQTEILKNKFGEKYFFEKGGQLLATTGSITKIMWSLEHPEYFEEPPTKFACVGDYIAMRLSGERFIDYSLAARTMLFDIQEKKWNHKLMEFIGITEGQLSKPVQAGTQIGYVLPEIAEELGLGERVGVVSGGHDQPCAMLGAGATCEGEAIYSLGTTETLVCRVDKYKPELYEVGMPCYPHVVANQYITVAGNFTGGNLLQWYKDTFAEYEQLVAHQKKVDIYTILMEEMANEPSGLLVLPHFTITGSPWNDSESCGLIAGLGLSTTKGEYIRALQEGVTYEILLNKMLLQKIGVKIDLLITVGGGTNSNKLMQLKSDVLGVPLYFPKISEAPCKGAALLAGYGCGILTEIRDCWRNNHDERHSILPNIKNYQLYREQYKKYQNLYQAVQLIYLK
ncbi:MAG: FGGY-family carbohydrate kinase [Lachnospiraceae bacterium]